jgi:hypothetical protein
MRPGYFMLGCVLALSTVGGLLFSTAQADDPITVPVAQDNPAAEPAAPTPAEEIAALKKRIESLEEKVELLTIQLQIQKASNVTVVPDGWKNLLTPRATPAPTSPEGRAPSGWINGVPYYNILLSGNSSPPTISPAAKTLKK